MMKTYSALCIAVCCMVMACTSPPKSESSESTVPTTFETTGSIERLLPELDLLIPAEAKIEVLASGFTWSEGPLLAERSKCPDLFRCSQKHRLQVDRTR